MFEYKKRLRILADKQGFGIEYLPQGVLRISRESAVIEFRPMSRTTMDCIATGLPGGGVQFTANKELVFDIVFRFTTPHLQVTLQQYNPSQQPLTLADYVLEENGKDEIEKLKRHIVTTPDEPLELRGNCIEIEYRRGVAIISDELLRSPLNMLEMHPQH
jgi:hypothetical protein